MNKKIVLVVFVVAVIGGLFFFNQRTAVESMNEEELTDGGSATSVADVASTILRACSEMPRNWGFEDDSIQYDVSLRAGERCQDSMGMIFRFDRYSGTLSEPIAEMTIIVDDTEIPFSYEPLNETPTIEMETPLGKRILRGCGIGKSIQSPDGRVSFMVGTDRAPECPNGLG